VLNHYDRPQDVLERPALDPAWWVAVRTKALRRYRVPDLADQVIHFTGRQGGRINVDDDILNLSDEERLSRIVTSGTIRAFATWAAPLPVVCFTESTPAALRTLIADGRYTPFGVAFNKQAVFDQRGGPALYVRGDEWHHLHALPNELRSRAVRFWPGAEPDAGEALPDHLTNPSEWLHEREWRVPANFRFDWDDVAYVLATDAWFDATEEQIRIEVDENYAGWFAGIPRVTVGGDGRLYDASGLWS
jgi:hypothetical protein